ncbi:DUF6578 domain-containing protein [Saccharopolyspora mangrovi]|uniref:DUF6578 domain-containing protein n=1 Tax=Saccharopolyspora mangrovi TaxID=3082379 RepID=A0ABU6A7T7_9PSEU|nr:DUF6578 domain-containing protein [Saccharopolyspora sp. S2-29]MEB3367549.1 DUF6578 domain-containing protein [Saccharopolyspora sp. S2-29]
MTIRAWLTGWEMECCGTPFRVGDEVAWPLIDLDDKGLAFVRERLGDDAGAPITHSAVFHGRRGVDVPKTPAHVTGIHAVLHRFELIAAREVRPIPHSGRLVWLHDSDDRADLGLGEDEQFAAYLVDLDLHDQQP